MVIYLMTIIVTATCCSCTVLYISVTLQHDIIELCKCLQLVHYAIVCIYVVYMGLPYYIIHAFLTYRWNLLLRRALLALVARCSNLQKMRKLWRQLSKYTQMTGWIFFRHPHYNVFESLYIIVHSYLYLHTHMCILHIEQLIYKSLVQKAIIPIAL